MVCLVSFWRDWGWRVNIQDLIDEVLAEMAVPRTPKRTVRTDGARVRTDGGRARTGTGRVYTDEPIVMRGSQMANYVPPRIEQMRALEHTPESRAKPGAWLFYQQAKLMEDYEDNVASTSSYWQYFPTYLTMNNRQLRSYFSWRTDVRHERPHERTAPISYVFVHLYELICGVGVTLEPLGRPREGLTEVEQGFYAIEHFWQTYDSTYPDLGRYAKRWLRDYVVYHGLDSALYAPYLDDSFTQAIVDFQEGLRAWNEYEEQLPKVKKTEVNVAAGAPHPGEERMFDSLGALSSYRPRVSRLYRDRPETFSHVCCAVVADLARHYEKRRKYGLVESLFGDWYDMPVTMFMNAVFWDESRHEDCAYELSPHNLFVCKNGYWVHRTFHGTTTRSTELGRILRVCDQRLREAIGYKHKLTEKDAPKYVDKFVSARIAERLAWEEERERRAIHVDLSQLAGIRAAASVTRESLLLDEEREEALVAGAGVAAGATVEPAAAAAGAGAAALESAANGAAAEPAAAVAPGMAEPALFDLASETTPTAGESERGDATATGPLDADTPVATSAATPAASAQAAAPGSSTSPAPAAPFGLTSEELALLEVLLDHQPPQAGASLDMLVDSVNEKLFDLLGDTALEFDLMSGMPSIIEDYEQDVREAIAYE